MIDDSRARSIFRKVALVLLFTLLLIYLTDLIFGLFSLRGIKAGTFESTNAYERIFYRSTWAGIIYLLARVWYGFAFCPRSRSCWPAQFARR